MKSGDLNASGPHASTPLRRYWNGFGNLTLTIQGVGAGVDEITDYGFDALGRNIRVERRKRDGGPSLVMTTS
jgi:hypothetical protein